MDEEQEWVNINTKGKDSGTIRYDYDSLEEVMIILNII